MSGGREISCGKAFAERVSILSSPPWIASWPGHTHCPGYTRARAASLCKGHRCSSDLDFSCSGCMSCLSNTEQLTYLAGPLRPTVLSCLPR